MPLVPTRGNFKRNGCQECTHPLPPCGMQRCAGSFRQNLIRGLHDSPNSVRYPKPFGHSQKFLANGSSYLFNSKTSDAGL